MIDHPIRQMQRYQISTAPEISVFVNIDKMSSMPKFACTYRSYRVLNKKVKRGFAAIINSNVTYLKSVSEQDKLLHAQCSCGQSDMLNRGRPRGIS